MEPVGDWDWTDAVVFAANLLTIFGAIGIGAVFLQLVGDRNARHRDFERMYVERYWSIADRLPARFVLGQEDFEVDDHKRALADYLMLCEDELDMRKRGYVSDKTWEVWAAAIIDASKNEKLAEVMSDFPKGRLDLLKAVEPDNADPLNRAWLRRWWEGLA